MTSPSGVALVACLLLAGCGTASWVSRDPEKNPPDGITGAKLVCQQRVTDALGGNVDLFSVSAASGVLNLCMSDFGYVQQ